MRAFLDPRRVDRVTLQQRKIVLALNGGALAMGVATLAGLSLIGLVMLAVGSGLWLAYRQWRYREYD
jgi:hypothetical protein